MRLKRRLYSVPDERRLNLEYYKNNILHFFTSFSFVSASILSSREDTISLDRMVVDCRFLKDLFRNEFIFDSEKRDLDDVQEVLMYMKKTGMVRESGTGILAPYRSQGNGASRLETLCRFDSQLY